MDDHDGKLTDQRRGVNTLDVEDEDDRQHRIQFILEQLNSTTANYKAPTVPSFDFGDRKTYPVNPPTELLSRVQAFLPQLEASNVLLAQRVQADPKSVDIENVEDKDGQYIEMQNLGLGVFEERAYKMKKSKPAQDEDEEMFMSSSDTCSDSDESDVETDASSEIITSFQPARPIRPLPKRKATSRPEIVVLGDQPSA